jgi:hypothetical protein
MRDRVSAQPFAGGPGPPRQRTGCPLRLVPKLTTLLALAVVLPAAGAILGDQLWIEGVYDGGDCDDLIALSSEFHAPGIALQLVDRWAMSCTPPIRDDARFSGEARALGRPRAPPRESEDAARAPPAF